MEKNSFITANSKSKKLPTLAIIIPCYNEEIIIKNSSNEFLALLNRLIETNKVSEKSYISFIDDGSSDKTWEILNEISKENDKIKALRLLYNTGTQNALMCGMTENISDIYITTDCDLQDDINAIVEMVDKYNSGDFDVIYGVRNNRETDSFWKRVSAESFYKLINFLLKPKLGGNGANLVNHSDFRLVTKNVTNFLKNIKEHDLYLRGLIYSKNFKHDIVFYSRKKRCGGTSKYSISQLIDLGINGIIGQTLFPLRCIFILSIIFFIYSLIVKSEIFFIGSIILLAIGLVGEYLGRIFIESKNRPNFIISEKINY